VPDTLATPSPPAAVVCVRRARRVSTPRRAAGAPCQMPHLHGTAQAEALARRAGYHDAETGSAVLMRFDTPACAAAAAHGDASGRPQHVWRAARRDTSSGGTRAC
jgi:hypothetical protein